MLKTFEQKPLEIKNLRVCDPAYLLQVSAWAVQLRWFRPFPCSFLPVWSLSQDLTKIFFLLYKMLPRNVTVKNAGKLSGLCSLRMVFLLLIKQHPVKKSKVRFKDRYEIACFARKQTLYCRHLIKEKAKRYLPPFFIPWQVLCQHDLIVAEIQKCFPGIASRQSTSAHMVHDRLGATKDPVSVPVKAPA